MSTVTRAHDNDPPEQLHTVPLRRVLAAQRAGGTLNVLESLGEQAHGAITRVGLGPFRPYLVTHPAHLQHVLRRNAGNYPRGAAMWKPFSRLTGHGIAGEGPQWRASRDILQKAFSARYLDAITDQMAGTIEAAVGDLTARADAGPVDAGVEMTRIVQRVVNLVFFGDRIPPADGDRLGAAISTAMSSFGWRMAMPFVPHAVPMPGDRRFRRATRTVNEVLEPIVTQARQQPRDGQDVVGRLLRGLSTEGVPLTDKQVRDDIVSLFVAGSESTSLALTWVWVALDQHPHVADALRAEVDRVVGQGPVRREHLAQLSYTRCVLQEVLRIHSVGWAIPRMAVEDDVIGEVPIKAGSTLVISPYLTHRLGEVWERPLEFDPHRFTAAAIKERQRRHGPLAYLPFGDGAHACLGEHFFHIEATLILAALVSRARPALDPATPVRPRLTLTLQPSDPVALTLTRR